MSLEMEPSANQGRAWTMSYYYDTVKEGLYILSLGHREWLCYVFSRKSRDTNEHMLSGQTSVSKEAVSSGQKGSLTLSSQQSLKQPILRVINETKQKNTFRLSGSDEDKKPTTLNYGFGLLSRMLAAVGLIGPAFALDLRLGLAPTRRFIVINYSLNLVWFFFGWFFAHIFIELSLTSIVPKLARNMEKLFRSSVYLAEIGYLFFGIFNCSYILYQRVFLHDFVLYKCSFLSLSRAFQRRQMVTLFLTLATFAFLAEPVFAMVSIMLDVKQPQVWPHLSLTAFTLVKMLISVMAAAGANLISISSIIIPLMTCYLMVSSTKHLKNILKKQSLRYKRPSTTSSFSTASTGRCQHNEQLRALLDDRTRQIIKDYACDTLTVDWPDFTVAMGHQDQKATSLGIEIDATNLQAASSGDRMLVMQLTQAQGNFGPSAGSLLFLYKNLIKNLSELKGMIMVYEQTFGYFHLVSTLLNCLIVSQWVTVALTEVRQDTTTAITGSVMPSYAARMSSDIPPYVLRIGGGVITFIVSNIFVFLKCDCLPDQLFKIRCQLFRMNIDLACEALEAQRASWSPRGSFSVSRTPSPSVTKLPRQSISKPIISGHQRTTRALSPARRNSTYGETKTQKSDQWPELEQIWSLYDQFERISLRANFRFSSEIYYSKRCLLLVFGRSVSLILLFIQIIDVYSYA